MKNSSPFLDPRDASEGVKTFFSEGVSLFSNQTPPFIFQCHSLKVCSLCRTCCIYFPASSWLPCSFQFVCVYKRTFLPLSLLYD